MAPPCVPPGPQQSPWRVVASAGLSFGSLHSHLEARNRWWLWHFLFTDLAVESFISQYLLIHFSSVQSLSHVRLFATLWIAARQASLSTTNSWSIPKLTCIESVMPSSHLILCHPLLFLPPIPPSIRVFSSDKQHPFTPCPSSPGSWQLLFYSLFHELDCFQYLMKGDSCGTGPSLSGLFLLT